MKNCKTLKNKLVALGLIGVGIAPILIDHDATCLVLFGLPAIGLLFAKENYID